MVNQYVYKNRRDVHYGFTGCKTYCGEILYPHFFAMLQWYTKMDLCDFKACKTKVVLVNTQLLFKELGKQQNNLYLFAGHKRTWYVACLYGVG